MIDGAMGGQRDARHHAADRIDFGGVEIGLDRDEARAPPRQRVARGGARESPARGAPAARVPAARRRAGTDRSVADLAAVVAAAAPADARAATPPTGSSAEKEKMTNRISRCVSMTAGRSGGGKRFAPAR
jgi:hypothetical protein